MQPKNQSQPVYNIDRYYSSYGSLVALGIEIERREILEPIREKVTIKQKVIRDTPFAKLTDALIGILSGASGLIEVNKRVRPEKALQMAFGRRRCAEQSVISDTLDACTAVNVKQMQQAMTTIYQGHSQGYQHDYDKDLQLIDVDMSGQPCGKKAEFASKGIGYKLSYFVSCQARNWLQFTHEKRDPKSKKYSPAYTGYSGR